MENTTEIQFTPELAKRFKQAHKKAVKNREHSFHFEDVEFLTAYAGFTLEYLESVFKTPQFEGGDIHTTEKQAVNDLIMAKASEIAEMLTEKDCKINNIECWVEDNPNEFVYSEEAQQIFNNHYDREGTELFELLNRQLKVIGK